MPDKRENFPDCALHQRWRKDVGLFSQPLWEQSQSVTWKKFFAARLTAVLLVIFLMAVNAAAEMPTDARYQRAMLALINRQFSEAAESFAKLLSSNPAMGNKIALPYAEALLGLADTLRQKDPSQAISLLRKALQLDPQSVRAHFQLALILTGQKDYAKAIESYQQAIALNPQFADSFFNLGFIYAVAKDFTKAEEMYIKAVALHPDYLDEALFNLALVQSKQNKKEQSLANLNKALTVNPENKAAQNYLKQLQGASEQ